MTGAAHAISALSTFTLIVFCRRRSRFEFGVFLSDDFLKSRPKTLGEAAAVPTSTRTAAKVQRPMMACVVVVNIMLRSPRGVFQGTDKLKLKLKLELELKLESGDCDFIRKRL